MSGRGKVRVTVTKIGFRVEVVATVINRKRRLDGMNVIVTSDPGRMAAGIKMKKIKKNVTSHKRRFKLKKIMTPANKATCCGERVYVLVKARVCKNASCAASGRRVGSGRFSTVLRCN